MIEISIIYPIKSPDDFEIVTNVKDSYIIDLLADWVHNQIGRGKDSRDAVDRDVYHINFKIDLTYDAFSVQADTGNEGLTVGVVMDVIYRLNNRKKSCCLMGNWSSYEI
jgi:hypothetical protein